MHRAARLEPRHDRREPCRRRRDDRARAGGGRRPGGRALRRRDAATLGILVAVAVYIGYAFTTSTISAFLLLIPIALQAPVQPSLMAMMSRRATADTQGEVQGISAMAMGLGQLAAPMLLTGRWLILPPMPRRCVSPARRSSAAIFGLLAILMLRRLPRVTQTADQMPPSVTA